MSAGFRRIEKTGRSASLRSLFAWCTLFVGCAVGCRGTEEPVFITLEGRPVAKAPDPTPHVTDAGPRHAVVEEDDAGMPGPPTTVIVIDEDAGPGPDPGLDPSVSFTWKESLPGQGMCGPGRYIGRFECTVAGQGIDDDPPPEFSGVIFFSLSSSSPEAAMLAVNGTVTGRAFYGELQGALVCADNSFTAKYAGGAIIDPLMILGMVSGTFTGKLDRASLLIEGTVTISNDKKQTCTGKFAARVAP